ncbi:MAG: hypothetical protein SV422_01090, partial [Pseudomonadota bacterium]|nr:hypothetical protein [Pseudomonadota bacterium]
MNAARRAVLALALCCLAFTVQAQHRFTTEAFIGLDRMPLVVADFTRTQDVWRRLGFLLKPGPAQARNSIAQIKFEDGSGIDLLPMTAATADAGNRTEGPMSFAFHVRDMSAFRAALRQTRLRFNADTGTFDRLGLDYLQFDGDSRADNDRAWLRHPNGATAMSRVWLAPPRGDVRNLQRVF